MLLFVFNCFMFCVSVDCIVADDNPLLDFISIKNLNLNLNYIYIEGQSHTFTSSRFLWILP